MLTKLPSKTRSITVDDDHIDGVTTAVPGFGSGDGTAFPQTLRTRGYATFSGRGPRGFSRPLKNGGQTNKTVSRSSEAAPLAVRLMEGVLLKLIVSMRLS